MAKRYQVPRALRKMVAQAEEDAEASLPLLEQMKQEGIPMSFEAESD